MATPQRPPLIVILLGLCAVLNAVYWLALCCFFGPTASPGTFQDNLTVRVLSLDAGIVGTSFLKFFEQAIAHPPFSLPGYSLEVAGLQGETSQSIQQGVNDGDVWGAVYVTAGATQTLMSAVSTANSSYDPTGAIMLVYDEGRANVAVNTRVVAPTQQLLFAYMQRFAAQFLTQLAANTSSNTLATLAQTAPTLLTRPVAFRPVNLHPFTAPVTQAALMVGMILVMVFAMIVSTVLLKVAGLTCVTFPPVRRMGIVACVMFFWAGTLCLSFTCILTVLHTRLYSAGDWVSFWLLQWLVMLIFGYFFAAIGLFGGVELIPPVFFVVLILNATAGLNVLELASPFFRWGVVLPLYHSTMASKTLLYGSYDRLYVNIPVLCAWLVVVVALFVFAALRSSAKWNVTAESMPIMGHVFLQPQEAGKGEAPGPSGSAEAVAVGGAGTA